MDITALIEFAKAYDALGSSVQNQLDELLDRQENADLNPNAVELMTNLDDSLRAIDIEIAVDLEQTIECWQKGRVTA